MRSGTLRNGLKQFVLVCMVLLFALSGCASSGSGDTFEVGGGTFQTGFIADDSSIGDYFTFTGSPSDITLNTRSGSFHVYYQQTEDSGWVLWTDSRYAYTETNVGEESMQSAAMGFGMEIGEIEAFELDKW